MRNHPTHPMDQHKLFIESLCTDWLEAGTVTRKTPRADAVREITHQLNHRDGGMPNKLPPSNSR